jgi:hypothetical protein
VILGFVTSVAVLGLGGRGALSASSFGSSEKRQQNERLARHAQIRAQLKSTDPNDFRAALSALASLEEPGALSLWESALENESLELRKQAWDRYRAVRDDLSRKELAPQIARIASSVDEVRRLADSSGLEVYVWRSNGDETVVAAPAYSLEHLSRSGLSISPLYETIAEWQQARLNSDPQARMIAPDYQSDVESKTQIRIAVIDSGKASAPEPGYSAWLGDSENVLMRSDSFIAYLDVFTSDGSPDSIRSHVEERYTRRGHNLAGFFTAEEFAEVIGRFFPGKTFKPGPQPSSTSDQIAPALAEGRFHSYQEALAEFTALADSNPALAKLVNLGTTFEGRQIFALKISRDAAVNDSTKPDVLITGCHHAREWISVEPPIYFAKQLVEGYSRDDKVRYMVDRLQIWIVPIVNPDGLTFSQSSANDQLNAIRLWRKNRRPISISGCASGTGVDLNRNYDYQWRADIDQPCPAYHDDYGASDFAEDELYRGPGPNSELEVKALNALTGDPARNFRARLDYHNFGQLVLYPWGYQEALAPDDGQLSQLANRMSDLIFANGGQRYAAQRSIRLYPSTGLATDYAYAVNRIPASLTIELRPVCCEFNVPENEIGPINEENWVPAGMILMWSAGTPFLQSVNAFQTGPDGATTKLVYSARWTESEGARRMIVDTRFPRVEAGLIRLRLQFSKPMDAALTPAASLGRNAPFDELRLAGVSGGWQKTVYENDTWVGEAAIPADSMDGEWRLRVSASDISSLSLDARPETIASYATGTNGWLNYEDASDLGVLERADLGHLLPATLRAGEFIVLVGSPKGGDRLAGGDFHQVAWTAPRDLGFIPVQQEVWLSTDGGHFFAPIATGIPGTDTSRSIAFPASPTTRAIVRVFARGGSLGYTVFGDSEGHFSIGANVGSAAEISLASSELIEQSWTDSSVTGPDGPLAGPLRLGINLTVRNRGAVPIANPLLRVAEITRNYVLLSRDSSSQPRSGARQPVNAGSDDLLSPGEQGSIRLMVGLLKRKKFNLSASLFGVPLGATVNASDPVLVWRGKPRTQ